jgi:hypothetical protein
VRAKLALALVAALAALGACELALRALDLPRRPAHGWTGCGEHAHGASPQGGCNELGFRGRPFDYGPDDFVVVLLGDSGVVSEASAFERMPERLLEAHLAARGLPSRVVSLAAPGWGQDQQLCALEAYLARWRADLVLVWITERNDLWNNLFPTHSPRDGAPKPTWRLVDGALVGPDRPWLARSGRDWRLLDLWDDLVRRSPDAAWERDLPPAYAAPPGLVPELERVSLYEHWASEKTHSSVAFTPRSARMVHALALTRALIAAIAARARAAGAGFLAFEDQRPSEAESVQVDVVVEAQGARYRLTSAQYRANLRELLDGLPAVCIPVRTPDPQISEHDEHLRDEAIDDVLGQLAEELARRGMLAQR